MSGHTKYTMGSTGLNAMGKTVRGWINTGVRAI